MENTRNLRQLRLHAEVRAILRCPRCGGGLNDRPTGLECAACETYCPVIDRAAIGRRGHC
jgi:hypothetical protein